MKWWQKTNVYEIYVNSFQDSDGDGYGDIRGIIRRLDYLKELEIGAVWLTPVFASPMDDNGYDVSDYYAINPLYGTFEDMDRLLEEAAKRGIRIVMDLVFNHTSDQHRWFIESSKGKDNAYSDWYIWKDAGPDGGVPNNWRSIFGGSAWTWSESRQQYYLHTFAVSQPDLNWENPDVRQALFDIANHWADKGAGGFRMDAIPYIKKPADFSDGKPDSQDGTVNIHTMTANTDGILDFLREFKDKVLSERDIFTVGEANGVSSSELSSWVGTDGVMDMIFEFSHSYLGFREASHWCEVGDWKLTELKKALSESQRATATNGWYPIYFENHDQPRSVNQYFPEEADKILAAKAMGLILFTLRGTPFIYQGEELGYTNVSWPDISYYNDIGNLKQYSDALERGYSADEAMAFVHRFSRDNARTPMQWGSGKNAGFTEGTPWLPLHDDYETENAEKEASDPDSVLSWYRRLAAFRKENEVLIDGSYREILPGSEQVYAFIRENADQALLIVVNFTGEEASLGLSEAGIIGKYDPEILLSNYNEDGSRIKTGNLRPYEAVLIQIRKNGSYKIRPDRMTWEWFLYEC